MLYESVLIVSMGYGDGIIKELVGYLAGIKLIIILRVSIIIIRFPNACSTAKDRSMSHECVVIVWLRILLNIGYTPLGSLCTDGRTYSAASCTGWRARRRRARAARRAAEESCILCDARLIIAA